MVRATQEVRIKKDIDVPRLKGKLRPIIVAPIRPVLKPFIKDKLPLYIEPLPLQPIIMKAVEPTLKEPVELIIPEYVGTEDEQPEIIYKTYTDEPPADQGRETFADDEDTAYSL